MLGRATRLLPYALAFFSSMCIMTLELVSSRLVARHVGASLTVWTSVIGIILGGICLGNVLGGRLADRVEPRRAVGPLLALGSFLTLFSLWMNAWVGYIVPSGVGIPWELRTVLVVCLDFLVPATVLGMVGPVVAKMAVEQARKAGSAIGDVYFWGAVGSITGTFFCGFVLTYLAPSSIIVLLVAAALATLAATLIQETAGLVVGLLSAVLLLIGSVLSMLGNPGMGAVDLGSYQINYVALAGNLAGCLLGFLGVTGLLSARRTEDEAKTTKGAAAKLAADSREAAVPTPSLTDLAMLAFIASLAFMALEMVAGRLVSRHLGSSIYGWTSVIGVLLGGLSVGNFLGGKIADFVKNERQASWLFLAASIVILVVIPLDHQPWFVADYLLGGTDDSVLEQANSLTKLEAGPVAISLSWPFRILFVVTLVFFPPAVTLGTVSPVVAKLAVDRLKQFRRTGTAIGQVYAWGMVGSILGTFLTGFVLINVLGTKGVILTLGTLMAFCATFYGPTWHAVWAGIPLGLCALAFTPPWFVDLTVRKVIPFVSGERFEKLGTSWGIREERGNLAGCDLRLMPSVSDVTGIPSTGSSLAVVADVNHVLHFRVFDNEGKLVVDTDEKKLMTVEKDEKKLVDPDAETDEKKLAEHARQIAELRKELENLWPPHEVTRNEKYRVINAVSALGDYTSRGSFESKYAWIDESNYYFIKINHEALLNGELVRRTLVLDNLIHGYFMLGHPERLDYDYEHIYALVAYRAAKASGKLTMASTAPAAAKESTPPPEPTGGERKGEDRAPAKTKDVNDSKDAKSLPAVPPAGGAPKDAATKAPAGLQSVQASGDDKDQKTKAVPKPIAELDDVLTSVIEPPPDNGSVLPPVKSSTMTTLFLGGGAYCFQRHMQFAYPGTKVDVAEIDPDVTNANFMATGLPRNTTIETYWGDARQFVDLHQDTKKYDLIFGDAFNDFSVPWHLTTLEFNEKLKKMLTPNGVYMINIIDAYESDEVASRKAEEQIKDEGVIDEAKQKKIRDKAMAKAYRFGGFVGAWVNTAKRTFDHVYIFGTDAIPGAGSRETFVVVASNQELDLNDLGHRLDDPKFYKRKKVTTPERYSKQDEEAIDKRSRKIILTDDYAPVENLLAPVAETRGDD